MSSYDEWYHTGLGSDLAFSPATASRLSQPLIGVCTMKHTFNPQRGFTVFQMSSVGDLFCQPFDSKGSKDSEGKHKESGTLRSDELSPEAKILCQKWIHIADEHKDNFVKTAPCQVEYVETEKGLLCDSIASLPESHPCCVLCNDRQGETVTDQAESESSICERCGVEIKYGCNLVKNQKNHGVLTRRSLNVQHNVKELGIFPDLKMATDPLSKSLWVNWNSTEPVPVILSGDKKAESQPDIQEKTVKEEMTPLLQNATSTHISNSVAGNVHESSPQKQSTPSKSQAVDNPPKVKTDKKPARHVMGF